MRVWIVARTHVPGTPGHRGRRPRRVVALTRRTAGLLVALLCALLVLALAPGSASAGNDPTTGPTHKNALPVTIVIDSITPTTLGPDGVLTITATATNTGQETIDDPWVRLQRAANASSRSQLFELDQSQPGYTTAIGPITDLSGPLKPGEAKQIQVQATTSQLGIDDQGIYPILININGETNSGPVRVGQAAFSVPYFEQPPAAPTRVAWVIPLIDQPRRSAQPDVFVDDELNTLISPGGRLYRLLAGAEKYAGKAQLSLLVDPELISEVDTMAHGYKYVAQSGVHKGKVVDGSGSAKAADWLDRLIELAKTTPIMTTTYADVDTVALARNNLGDLITLARKQGTSVVEDILKTQTVRDVDLPVGGVTTDQAITAEHAAGVNTFILSGAAYGQDDYLESDDGITENASTVLGVPGASVHAVVADPALTRILGDGSTYAAGPVAATQRFAAELAAITMQDTTQSRSVLVVPPSRWDPDQKLLDGALAATTATSWIAPASFAELAAQEPVDRGALDYPTSASAAEIPSTALAPVVQTSKDIDSMRSMFSSSDADTVLGPLRLAVLRAVSSAHRGDPALIESRTDDIEVALKQIRNAVQIVPPSNGTYTLSSSNAPLPFTVENDLGVPVKCVIGLDETRSSGVKVGGTNVVVIAPNSRATIKVSTVVERSGIFSVVAQIHTPSGQPLGSDVVVSVRSSVYGGVALAVTGAAFAILLVLIARRYVIRRRNKRLQREADARATEASLLEEADEPVPFGDYRYHVPDGDTTASIVVPPELSDEPADARGTGPPDPSATPPLAPHTDPDHHETPPDSNETSPSGREIGNPE